ncbi:hypothetical protein BS50DRAFT_586960 [Corynespora cassiicola Philippines]|uniref:Uncharacterized protein n=1 Tax=Corynespora cassiicola Philippines TaxID=1448308 RepID=A0A2T2NQJ7_CORCC|nr:hypothetical protein BS50DRAFT_586960 [Corynespora cassiicola Philippines]
MSERNPSIGIIIAGVRYEMASRTYKKPPPLQVAFYQKSRRDALAHIQLACKSWLCNAHSLPITGERAEINQIPLIYNQLGYTAVSDEDIERAKGQIGIYNRGKDECQYPNTEGNQPWAYFTNIASSQKCSFGYTGPENTWKQCGRPRIQVAEGYDFESDLNGKITKRSLQRRVREQNSKVWKESENRLWSDWGATWPCFRCSIPKEHVESILGRYTEHVPNPTWLEWFKYLANTSRPNKSTHAMYWVVECEVAGVRSERVCWVNLYANGTACSNQRFGRGPFEDEPCCNVYGTIPKFATDPLSEDMLMWAWPTKKILEEKQCTDQTAKDEYAKTEQTFGPLLDMVDLSNIQFGNEKIQGVASGGQNVGYSVAESSRAGAAANAPMEPGLYGVTQATADLSIAATASADDRKREASDEPADPAQPKRTNTGGLDKGKGPATSSGRRPWDL